MKSLLKVLVDVLFKILGSSSSGNSAILKVLETTVLIDAGMSGKKLELLLKNIDIKPDSLDAVFITHEHNDHSAGIRGISKFKNLPFFANQDTIQALQPKLQKRPNWKIFETGKSFSFGPFKIEPFSIPHDAYDPVGFYFEWGEEEDLFNPLCSLAWVTDLGFVPELVKEKIRKAKILVIESNHCSKMLEEDTKRPWSLKQRIRGRHGHLSNDNTYELLSSLDRVCWEKVFLMHLSKDCNNINKIQERFSSLKEKAKKFSTYIIDPSTAEAVSL